MYGLCDIMYGLLPDSRRKQSFPLFWIFGSLAGIGFVIMGGCIIHAFSGIDPSERDNAMLAAGIGIIVMGVLLLGGVIYTLKEIMLNPDDLSYKVDVYRAKWNKKYDANKLVNYLERSHNNVILFNTDEGQMRVFGSTVEFIAEICMPAQNGLITYHLTDPSVTDEQPVVIGNIFLERFPVRKNRIVGKEQVINAIELLCVSKNLTYTANSLPFVNTTEETNRLIEKDAYIIPSVPLVFHKKKNDIDRALKEKEERVDRAIQELRTFHL